MKKRATSAELESWDVVWMPISELKPYRDNPRRNAAAVDVVAALIKKYDWQQPIVTDKKKVIIVGHTRFLAAKKLKMDRVPVRIDTKLTPAQVRAYRIADNRSAEIAEWDDGLLAKELQLLHKMKYDLSHIGFDGTHLQELLAMAPTVEFKEFDENAAIDVKILKCPSCGHEFPK